jgi:hypothetical protein
MRSVAQPILGTELLLHAQPIWTSDSTERNIRPHGLREPSRWVPVNKSQKFFRYLWRVNAVVIFLAAGAITVGVGSLVIEEFGTRTARNREAEAGIPVVSDPKSHLTLGRMSVIPGTNVMRADLSTDRKAKGIGSSGGYSETRNILFIEPDQKEGHWLLPDNDHVISDHSDITTEDGDHKATRTIATAVLVKPPSDSPENASGRLLMFDPTGRKIVEVANNVRELHLASLSGGEVRILLERNRHFVLATFDPASLAKRGEQEIGVPQLN